jgi:hypothetical protein
LAMAPAPRLGAQRHNFLRGHSLPNDAEQMRSPRS